MGNRPKGIDPVYSQNKVGEDKIPIRKSLKPTGNHWQASLKPTRHDINAQMHHHILVVSNYYILYRKSPNQICNSPQMILLNGSMAQCMGFKEG